ncbi:uncharacterized protein NFIA_093260 [Aspergillus fischeri NRRL 181]|uniref:Uncharacterized protein n=1 Tax=Neosartorya fischeri (strain ATCC 1020 / DSM 3700 / CBS 544.65 / FGSC A1164 / JCM 1740 / NRRL 181 / WB 181) TaxID=331117 RepID=A1DJ06_NEOFI|nr:uncharacterized protein NFIA_093260 [Aspergillus fischeri NRRL 181]EAW19363.1 hypothetical protein NFIA_093260 [Aspergillus fischeri NRRL 181]
MAEPVVSALMRISILGQTLELDVLEFEFSTVVRSTTGKLGFNRMSLQDLHGLQQDHALRQQSTHRGADFEEGQVPDSGQYYTTRRDYIEAFGQWTERFPSNRIHYHEGAQPSSVYNWELGVHIPCLIMEGLMATQQFELALKVARQIYDPRKTCLSMHAGPSRENWMMHGCLYPTQLRARFETCLVLGPS